MQSILKKLHYFRELFCWRIASSSIGEVGGEHNIAFNIPKLRHYAIYGWFERMPVFSFQLERHSSPIAISILLFIELFKELTVYIAWYLFIFTSALSSLSYKVEDRVFLLPKLTHNLLSESFALIGRLILAACLPSPLKVFLSPNKRINFHANHAISVLNVAYSFPCSLIIMVLSTKNAKIMLLRVKLYLERFFRNLPFSNISINNFGCSHKYSNYNGLTNILSYARDRMNTLMDMNKYDTKMAQAEARHRGA